MAKSICGGCNEIFNSVGAFDAHRVGEYSRQVYKLNNDGKPTHTVIGRIPNARRCLSIEEMIAKEMLKNERGWWIVEAYVRESHQEAAAHVQ